VYLLHESMLSSVIFARDKWLDMEGLIYPHLAYLYVCPVNMNQYLHDQLKYWLRFNALDFTPIMSVYKQLLLEKPIVECLSTEQLMDDEKLLASFDLKTVTLSDLKSIQAFNVEFSAKRRTQLHGFAFWFDVIFNTDTSVVTLSTSPRSAQTHWKQTCAFLPVAMNSLHWQSSSRVDEGIMDDHSAVSLEEGDDFECYIMMNQAEENARHYEIDIGVDLKKNPVGTVSSTGSEESSHSASEDEDEHSVPCECGEMRCVLIKATLAKYDKEQGPDDEGVE